MENTVRGMEWGKCISSSFFLLPPLLSVNSVHFVALLGIMCLSEHTGVCCFEYVRTVCEGHPKLAVWRMWIDGVSRKGLKGMSFSFWCSMEIIKGSDCLISTLVTHFMSTTFIPPLLPCMTRHWIWPNLKSISCWLGLFWLVIWGWWQTVFVYLPPQRHNNRQHTWLDDTWAAWLFFTCTAVVIWLLYSSWLELLFIVYLDIEQLFVFVFELSLP